MTAADVWTVERVTSVAEIDRLVAIERDSFAHPSTRDMLLRELRFPDQRHVYCLRTAAGEIAGVCVFWTIDEEMQINSLAVAPEFRRRGGGARLLERALAEAAARGAFRATLEVRASNTAALRLYSQFGFTVSGVRRRYYTDPVEDGLILWRDPPPSHDWRARFTPS